METNKTAVIALGGNAITRSDQEDTIANQFANTRKSLDGIIELIHKGYNLVVTHGNGPQVGNELLRNEMLRGKAPVLPLGVLVANTEGGMGYMIEQSLQNRLKKENINRPVVTIITQMIVDENDPAIKNPSKFIGQFYTEEDAKIFKETRGWVLKKDSNRGWRRVVPSPKPLQVVESEMIKKLVESGAIVIAGGGGGIPVYIDKNDNLDGIDAVIDKDFASAVIAKEIGAEILAILTSVEKVSINFGKENQQDLGTIKLKDLIAFKNDGHFPAGSMGPKIDSAIKFLNDGGKLVTITSLENAAAAIDGDAGTRIIPN